MDLNNTKYTLQNLVERKVSNILNSTDELVDIFFRDKPIFGDIAKNFLNAKKKEWIPQLQQYCDLVVETSCFNPDININQAVINAEAILNEYLNGFLSEKLGIPKGTVQIGLQVLLGNDLLKL